MKDYPHLDHRCKGERQTTLPADYVIVDTETTGFDPNRDRLLEISAIKIRSGEIVDTFSSLVKPDIEIPDHISKLTGIDDTLVMDAPEIDTVIPIVAGFIGEDLIVGHNVAFDLNFLTTWSYHITGKWLMNDYVDTMCVARSYHLPVEHYKLQYLKEYFGIEQEEAHRALADCYTTFELIKKLNELVPSKKTKKPPHPNHSHGLTITIGSFSRFFNDTEMDNECTKTNDPDIFDSLCDPYYFAGKRCVITGQLERFTEASAQDAVFSLGGIIESHVTTSTNILIVGTLSNGETSGELRTAQVYKNYGKKIKIINETHFYALLDERNSKPEGDT